MNRVTVLLLMISSMVFSQSGLQKISPIKDNKPSKTFYEVKEEFNKYEKEMKITDGYIYENGQKTKAPNWKIFKRGEWYWEQRVNLQTGEFPKTNSIIEYEKFKEKNKLMKTNSLNENWINLGTNSSDGGYAGIGRINCIAFHPTDANTFWVSSPSGGIWRTTDGGSNWTILNNNEAVLGVSDIAITSDYVTSQTLYIATGDKDGGSMWSLSGGQSADNHSKGVYKSTDGGATWTQTGLTDIETGIKIYRLLIHPTNNSILLASTSNGIYKTTDGGISWVKKSLNRWIDMEFKPGDPTIIYASSVGYYNEYINISTDGGETWGYTQIATGGYRGELAVSANDPTVVYCLVANSAGGLVDVYKSTNSGTSFSALGVSGKSMLGYYSDGSGSNTGQGTYDLCIAASPTDVNTVYLGGINTWKSIDGGNNWTINNMWTSYFVYNKSGAPVVHADKHTLTFQSGGVLFEGNDGGVYKTTNGGTSWTDLSNGLVISQLYRIGVSQTSSTKVLTGLQDNGSKFYDNGIWSDVKGGDGMECIIDFSNSNYMYATYVRGQISRSVNGGGSFPTNISANIPGGQPTGAWVTPYVIDQNNSSTLYAGYDQVWKTTDRGDSWTSASQVLSSTDKLRSLAIAPSNSNVLYAADQTNMWKTTDGGASNWTSITLPSISTSVTYITVHPTNPNKLWITYGGYIDGQKVYESTDGGASWTSISTGLPNIPIMCIVYNKSVTTKEVLFVGTDVGVYAKDGTNSWAAYNSGLPNVVVTELEIFYNPSGVDKLRAGTYGRGLWETEILAPLPVELTNFTAKEINKKIILNWQTATEVNNYGFEIERSSTPLGTIENNEYNSSRAETRGWRTIGFVEGHGNSNSPKDYSFVDDTKPYGKVIYRLKQIDTDGTFEYSDEVEIEVYSTIENKLVGNYPNPFNPTTTIRFDLAKESDVVINIYNVLGEVISTLVNQKMTSGKHKVEFDASNLSSGIYYYRFSTSDFVDVKKMMVIK
ncbi:Glycosyl hydrolase, BNR repeat precursor [hydrothermal vent metagenome]|uniref:Glycosyl hydrolase, BNR repeat n=1 Tax=hydrothermal vent metagenome TaxID=652676 RepID=A0A3B1CIF9_9ZZZZ